MLQVNRDLIRDLRRGFLRGLVLIAFPFLTVLAEASDARAWYAATSLLTLVAAAVVITGIEGLARRKPENQRFWHYLGILVLSGLIPFAMVLQAKYMVAVSESDAGEAINQVGREVARQFGEPLGVALLLLSVVLFGAIPTLLCAMRIRDEAYPTLAALKRAALIGLPLVFAPVGYVMLLVWVGGLSLMLSFADWIEGLVFRPPRGEGRDELVGRLARGEISRRDLHLAVILGHPAAISISGQRREESRLEDMLEELQYGGAATLARATHALASLAAPSAEDPEAARRALDLAGQAIRSNRGDLVSAEIVDWPWHRDAPASQRAIHSLLEAARSLSTGWGATTCLRSVKECAEIALEVSTREGARQAVVSALLPWVLEEYDPLPEAPQTPAGAEEEGSDAGSGSPDPAIPEGESPESEQPESEPAEPPESEPAESPESESAEPPESEPAEPEAGEAKGGSPHE